MMNAKDYKAEMALFNSSEAKQRAAAAKAHTISEFKKRFPYADISRFKVQVDFDPKRKATGEVLFPESDDSWTDPLLADRKYWSQAMKAALGMHEDGSFPFQLSPTDNPKKPIPAVDFSEKIQSSIGDVLNKELRIYVTPTEFFTTKFRQIFKSTQNKFTTSKYARKWLGGRHMTFWPQQLNFALWCARTGCGMSRDILFSSGYLDLSPQLRSFYLFPVYFTVRRILYEMGGIQSMSALPDDPTFNQKNNHYDIASYKRICAEFDVDPSSDFRFTHGQNHRLGYVNIKYSDGDFAQKKWTYPPANLSNPSSQRFADESGKRRRRKLNRLHKE